MDKAQELREKYGNQAFNIAIQFAVISTNLGKKEAMLEYSRAAVAMPPEYRNVPPEGHVWLWAYDPVRNHRRLSKWHSMEIVRSTQDPSVSSSFSRQRGARYFWLPTGVWPYGENPGALADKEHRPELV